MPKRILLTADTVGGVWQYSLDLARGLSRLGIPTVLAVMGPSPSETQRAAAGAIPGLKLIDTGLPLDWLAEDGAGLPQAAKGIAPPARDAEGDIVQPNT